MHRSIPKVYLSRQKAQIQGRTTQWRLRVDLTYLLAKSQRATLKCGWCLPAPQMLYRLTNRKVRTTTTQWTSTKTWKSSPRTRAQQIKIRMRHGTWILIRKGRGGQIAISHSISQTTMRQLRRTEKTSLNISQCQLKTLESETPLLNLSIYQWLTSLPRNISQAPSMRMNLTLESNTLMATLPRTPPINES